jgi:hypothetical protein
LSNWLEELRDRVVVRSQVGKRKLDAVFTRRELDRKLADVGHRIIALIREGRLVVPEDMTGLVAEALKLEERLEKQRADIAALKSETV